ncbi:hypothetical protein ACQ4PT_027528 [Festuca glaucescens]
MAAIEVELHGRALLASVLGTRPPVSPESLVQALERQAGVDINHVRVEITYPADFLVSFKFAEDYVRVYQRSGDIRCNGAHIAFKRWHRTYQAVGGKLQLFSKLSFDGIWADAWDWETVKQVVNSLGGHLVKILPSEDRWCLMFTAWMRNPCSIPKEYEVEIPEPAGLPNTPRDPEDPSSPPPPPPAPTFKRTLVHSFFIHIHDIVDRTPLCTGGMDLGSSDDDEDVTRRHVFNCWGGRMDGYGRAGAALGGGHPFTAPSGAGSSLDWGNRRKDGKFKTVAAQPARDAIFKELEEPVAAFGPPAAHEFLTSRLCVTPAPSVLGPRPAASAPVRRKRNAIPEGFVPRRSERVRHLDDGSNKGPVARAQTILVKRLGLVGEKETVTDQALDEYLSLFKKKPLAPQHLRAIAAFFDPDGVAFDEPAQEGFVAFSLPSEVEPTGA